MSKKIIIFLLTTFVNPIYAQSTNNVNLNCVGINKIAGLEMDIEVNPLSGTILGFPVAHAPGCALDDTHMESEISNIAVQMKCSNKIADSTLQLSRSTGNMTIITSWKHKKTFDIDEYRCRKIGKKLF